MMLDEDENKSESKITDNLIDITGRQTIVNPDNEKSKAKFNTLGDNKEQFNIGIDIFKYSAFDLMPDENENQPEAKNTDNHDDFVDNVAKHLLI